MINASGTWQRLWKWSQKYTTASKRRFRRKFEKKKSTFQKESFHEISLKLEDLEYIDIAEIKFW